MNDLARTGTGEMLVDVLKHVDYSDRVKRGNAIIRRQMAAKGSLGLSPLLEARRWEFLIPDGAFREHAVFDRILLVQIAENTKETFGDTSIVMPASSRNRKRDEACRGVIVSAGLIAMDQLRSNGIDVGHVVRFIRNAPWRMQVDHIEGHEIYELVMRSGDLVASEDLRKALQTGECKIEWDEPAKQHVFRDKSGKQWQPALPWIQDDL